MMMKIAFRMVLAASLCGAPSAFAQYKQYKGFCEASAAALVSKNQVAVASDDFGEILVFDRNNHNITNRIALTKLVPDVTDIEAAARFGDTIFWLTSHSLNKKGKDKSERKVFFAAQVNGDSELIPYGQAYTDLRAAIIKALVAEENISDPEKEKIREAELKATLNIEGMADASPPNAKGQAGSTQTDRAGARLIIGLRAPTFKTSSSSLATLIELANPFDLIGVQNSEAGTSQAPAEAIISRVVHLDLSDGGSNSLNTGRGIRDIARVGDRYLIIAGAEADGDQRQPKLFWWDGQSGHAATPGPDVDLSGMTPEAIVAWDDASAEIFGDNEGAIIDNKKCQDKTFIADAYFPSVEVDLTK